MRHVHRRLRSRSTRVIIAAASIGAVAVGAFAAVSAAPPDDSAPTTTVRAFNDPIEARLAAEGVLVPLVRQRHNTAIDEGACSRPDSSDPGSTFVCYGLRDDNTVIALRATIRQQATITMELIEPDPAPVDIGAPDGDTGNGNGG